MSSVVVIENENEVMGVVGGVVAVGKSKKLQAKYERLYMSIFMVLDGVSGLDESVKRSILEGIEFYKEDITVQSMFLEEHILNSVSVKQLRKKMKEERLLWKRENGLIPLKKRGGKKSEKKTEKKSEKKTEPEIVEEPVSESVEEKETISSESIIPKNLKNPKKKTEKNIEKPEKKEKNIEKPEKKEKKEKKVGKKLLKGVVEEMGEGVIDKVQIEVGKVKVVVDSILEEKMEEGIMGNIGVIGGEMGEGIMGNIGIKGGIKKTYKKHIGGGPKKPHKIIDIQSDF